MDRQPFAVADCSRSRHRRGHKQRTRLLLAIHSRFQSISNRAPGMRRIKGVNGSSKDSRGSAGTLRHRQKSLCKASACLICYQKVFLQHCSYTAESIHILWLVSLYRCCLHRSLVAWLHRGGGVLRQRRRRRLRRLW